ncbi:polyprenyl synthetase family protein [Rickettsiella grylli]|uniref:Octaprenyl-diphosphate synthase (Octaprenyl pyrophosphatesynthetase) (OPP synthetase) n=1 Tax=Rickettsiella grylli TaxID=59196 RepID=A8PLG7_9COXI|nr:polyprenyl synthetase family protein [Rickettsiella grylli]EDP45732.1 octaprenyl-diphosphate synthase (Octaprenyl pyrophosphatesynthetase) (OPP synthetase) [Rickettsiella grylli]OIZ99205.1 octaprenyl-diphosphate synthase [Rickettsiella grylli]
MNLAPIVALVKKDLDEVDALINRCLYADIPLIPQLAKHLINSGGKRLRPLIALLSAKAFGYQGKEHRRLAASLELIHGATLLHDDVIDGSVLRRGKKTANSLWGNSASVLVGDFLYSRAFQLISQINNSRVLTSLADATNTLAQSEVLQLINCYNVDVDEAYCLKVIQGKTGVLFSIAAEQPAMLTERPEAEISAMAHYGMHLGIAFQLIDDSLDYSGDPQQLGKSLGNDLSEGKPTLPIIYALQHASAEQAQLLKTALTQGDQNKLMTIIPILQSTSALEYTRTLARHYIEKSLTYLNLIPDSDYRQALAHLTTFAIERSY